MSLSLSQWQSTKSKYWIQVAFNHFDWVRGRERHKSEVYIAAPTSHHSMQQTDTEMTETKKQQIQMIEAPLFHPLAVSRVCVCVFFVCFICAYWKCRASFIQSIPPFISTKRSERETFYSSVYWPHNIDYGFYFAEQFPDQINKYDIFPMHIHIKSNTKYETFFRFLGTFKTYLSVDFGCACYA